MKTEEGYCLNNQRKGKNQFLNASQKSLTATSVTCVFLFVAFSPLVMFGLYTHTQRSTVSLLVKNHLLLLVSKAFNK